MHVHVHGSHGEAKFWLEPEIDLADNQGLRSGELRTVRKLISKHEDEIRDAWNIHFGG